MSERTLWKQCACERATASGPRLVMTETRDLRPEKDALEFGMTLVAMACDRCDTPWLGAPPARGTTEEGE